MFCQITCSASVTPRKQYNIHFCSMFGAKRRKFKKKLHQFTKIGRFQSHTSVIQHVHEVTPWKQHKYTIGQQHVKQNKVKHLKILVTIFLEPLYSLQFNVWREAPEILQIDGTSLRKWINYRIYIHQIFTNLKLLARSADFFGNLRCQFTKLDYLDIKNL